MCVYVHLCMYMGMTKMALYLHFSVQQTCTAIKCHLSKKNRMQSYFKKFLGESSFIKSAKLFICHLQRKLSFIIKCTKFEQHYFEEI